MPVHTCVIAIVENTLETYRTDKVISNRLGMFVKIVIEEFPLLGVRMVFKVGVILTLGVKFKLGSLGFESFQIL